MIVKTARRPGKAGVARSEVTSDPTDQEERREFERSLLTAGAVQSIRALMAGSGISQRELAARLGWSQPRISQILNSENLTLATAADIAWALGYRFEMLPLPVDRRGTPALEDAPPPAWVRRRLREMVSVSKLT